MNNLLTKKIKDKIKLLDDIDKQYISKVQIKKRKNEIPSRKEDSNIYMNSIEIMKNSKKENFDKVYSNFILSGDILGQNYSKKRNNSISNNNYDKEPTNEDTKYDNVEERLYNHGQYIKNKIEIQRQMENSKIKNSAKPKINKTRNKTEKTETRLYPNYQNNIDNNNNSNLNKTNNKSNEKNKNKQNNKSINNIIDINNFTYHPKLNKRSLILAKKMEPSSIRLNKKRKIETEEDLKPKNYYINLYQHKKDNTPRKITEKKKDSKNKNKSIYDKMTNLYLRGIEQRQKKEKKINENKIKKENEYKEYSYMPNINKVIPYYSDKNRIKKNLNINVNNSKRENKKNNIYEKNFEWKKNIVKENIKKKVINEEKIKSLCTFHPKITENSKPKSNKKLLNKVLEQMNDYVLKRQQNIKYKKSQENYRKKKLYENVDRYTPRSTIPHEFEFQTELREYSLGKNKNRSCENFHKNKNSEKKSFRDNENHFWFFKEDMSSNNYNSNISNVNESNNTKEANNHNMQFDFIEAVNMLHDK